MKFIPMLSILFACGETAKEQDTSTIETNEPSSETDTIDPCVSIEGATGNRMDGSIEFSDGTEAKGNVRVQMCNEETCYIASWSDDGDFCFPEGILKTGFSYSFDAVPLIGEENSYATPLSIIEITEDNTIIQLEQPLIIPKYSNMASFSETSFDAGNGLIVTVGETTEIIDNLYSVFMSPTASGLPLSEFSEKTLLGLWYFGPFETHTASPWSFHLENQTLLSNLEIGSQVEIYNASYDDHDWIFAGTATIQEDGSLISDTDAGIRILSSVLLAQ